MPKLANNVLVERFQVEGILSAIFRGSFLTHTEGHVGKLNDMA